MNAWPVFTLAFAAVILQAWVSRRGARDWYMGCIVPLLYGGVVAWMFMEDDLLRALQVILFGAVLPIVLLLSFRRRQRERQEDEEET